MKNKIYDYLIIIVISLIILAIINFFVFGFNSLDSNIINKKWYHYDFTTGYYDLLIFNNNKIQYNGVNQNKNYESCTTYNYDKKKNTLHLDCGEIIEIYKVNDNSLELKIDDYDKVFFDTYEDSINYEFKNYFGKNIIDYKDEKSQVTEYSLINSDKLISLMKEKGYSKIVFMGDQCTSIDCTLALDIMEKWIIKSSNVYYFDSNNMNNELINTISKTVVGFNKDINYYNGVYPKVLIIKNGKIVDKYDIKCTGFNCNSLYKNEF